MTHPTPPVVPNKMNGRQKLILAACIAFGALLIYAFASDGGTQASHELDGRCFTGNGLTRYSGVLTNNGKRAEDFTVQVKFRNGNRTVATDVEYLNDVSPGEEREFEALGRGVARTCTPTVGR